jgi:hypothetical protein
MKLVSLMLVSLLVCEGAGFAGQAPPTTATSQLQTQETPQAAKIKAKVQKRGIGTKSQVKVKLANGTEVKGYVSKIEESSFTQSSGGDCASQALNFLDRNRTRQYPRCKQSKPKTVTAYLQSS